MGHKAINPWAAAVAALSCAVSICHAQVRIAGRVSDENGRPVAAASVEMRRLPEGETVLLSTDVLGAFQAEFADPGNFEVRVERPGYFVFQGRAEFHHGPNQLGIALNHLQDFFQSVEVPSSPRRIDFEEPSDQKQLTNLEILEVPYPASQDVRNALPLLLGVVQDTAGRPHFNGGATDQTNFTLDGFNISDPVTGRFDARVNIESVRSVDVESSRFAVDKGRGSAGSVDLKTAMGDDRWRFGSTNFFPGLSTDGGTHLSKWTPRVTLSGPLEKGKVWFHNGFDAFYDVDTVRGLPRGQNRARALTASNLTRVQANLAPSDILVASFLYNYTDDTRRGLSFFDPAETTLNRRQDLYFGSLRNQKYYARGAIFEAGYAYSQSFSRELPQGSEIFEILPNGRRGNYFAASSLRTRRHQWLSDYYAPVIDWHGTHQVRVGADAQRSAFDRNVDRHEYRVLRGDDSIARVVTFVGNPHAARANLNLSEYVMDRWTPVTGLLVEGGVRFGWDQLVRRSLFSPRLAVAWAPKRLRDTKISAGTGVFYDALNLGVLSAHQDQVSLASFFSPSGVLVRGPVETGFVVNDRELEVPRYLITSVSVERKLPGDFYAKVNYLRKEGRRGLSFFRDAEAFGLTGAPSPASFYRLLNGRNDRYDAVEWTVRRTFGGRFEWMGGYIRSNARTDAVVDYSLENPIFADQQRGPFAWDAPNRFLTWGWAPAPHLPGRLRFFTRDTSIAYLVEYRTGFPFSVVNEEGSLVGRPNQRRLPSYFNVNLHFERRFRFLHYQWAWRFGVNNLTNNGNPNVVNNNIDSPLFLAFGRGQPRAFNVRLRFLGRR